MIRVIEESEQIFKYAYKMILQIKVHAKIKYLGKDRVVFCSIEIWAQNI